MLVTLGLVALTRRRDKGVILGPSDRKIVRRSTELCIASHKGILGVLGRIRRHCIRIPVSLLGSQHDKLISKRRLSLRGVVLTRFTERCTTV